MKKYISVMALLCIFAVMLSGCSKKLSYGERKEIEDDIESEIAESISAYAMRLLWYGADSITAFVFDDGTVSVSARVEIGKYIPEVAEEFYPAAVTAISDNSLKISDIEVTAFDCDVDGSIKDGTIESWTSYGGAKGTFYDEAEDIFKTNVDIEFLYDYYGTNE